MFSVHLILSSGPDYMYIMCNPPDVRWRVLNDTMSLYNLRIYWIYGLKGLTLEHPQYLAQPLGYCCSQTVRFELVLEIEEENSCMIWIVGNQFSGPSCCT